MRWSGLSHEERDVQSRSAGSERCSGEGWGDAAQAQGIRGRLVGWEQQRGPSSWLVWVQHPHMDCQETLQVRAKGTLADVCAGREL